MKIIRMAGRVIWKTWFGINFCFYLVLFYPVLYFFLNKESRFKGGYKVVRFMAKLVAFTNGIYYSIKHEVPFNANKTYVICSNHGSYLDIVICYCIFPNFIIFMGKSELGTIPLFNLFFKKMNILVDRNSRIGSHRAFIRAGQELEKSNSVVIFPEGTIPNTVPVMKLFKNGAFKLAIDKQVDILPITFLNNYKFLQTGPVLRSNGRPGVAKVIIHKPISVMGMTEDQMELLKHNVFETINAPLIKHHKIISRVDPEMIPDEEKIQF